MKKQKQKVEYHAIIDKVYRRNFHLIVNTDNQDFLDWVLEHHPEGKDDEKLKDMVLHCSGCYIFQFQPYCYLYVKEFNWTIDEQGVLVHELNHFVDHVFEYAGIPATTENTEVRAYYFEYIFKECYEALKPKKKKKKWP